MPVEASWHDDGQVIYVRFYGDVTFADMKESNRLTVQLRTQDNGELLNNVHQIIDLSDMTRYPTKISQFGDVIQLMKEDTNEGFIVLVGARGVAKFIGSVVSQVGGHKFKMVDTLDEVDAILERVKF